MNNYFVDTNVGIAYIFFHEPFHDESVNFENKGIYWSKHSKKEYNKIFKKKVREIKKVFITVRKNLCKELEKGRSYVRFEDFEHINYKDNKIILKITEIKTILNVFWNKSAFSYQEDLFLVIEAIDEYINDFQEMSFKRNRFFVEIIKEEYQCESYRLYKDIFNDLDSLGVHKEDCFIIIDANDFASKNISLSLIFVTFDRDFYKALKQYQSNLYLDNIYTVNSFE